MRLEGSCHCRAVTFAVESHTPQPFNWCYCSICRKTAGGGGYAINIMAEADSLEVTGAGNLGVYRAQIADDAAPGGIRESHNERHFCKTCASALWIANPRYADSIYPFASAIDTPLPIAAERVHLMLDFAAPWAVGGGGADDRRFPRYPEEAIVDWHRRRGLLVD